MKRRSVGWAVLAVVALVAAAAGALGWLQVRKQDQAVQALVDAAAIEWRRQPLDRSGATDALRRLVAHPDHDVDPRLMGARGELLLALDRVNEAWDAAGYLAVQPGASPEAGWLGARIAFRQHAVRGTERDLDTALALASQYAEVTGARRAAFLAWQCAWRGGRREAQAEMATLLQQQHADSPEAGLVSALADDATSLEELRDLERAFDQPPPELSLWLAVRLLEQEEGADPEDAYDRLQEVLAAYPASVDARNFAAVALHLLGRREDRDGYLRWLLDNAPKTDQRYRGWSAMLAEDAAERRG